VPIARALAFRHPGMDIHQTSIASLYLNGGVRGAYWLTFLGPALLERLGKDASAIRKELGADIVVHELANGVAIQARENPEPEDVTRNDRLPLVRKVAKLVEPVQMIQKSGIIFGPLDDFVRWQQRHLL